MSIADSLRDAINRRDVEALRALYTSDVQTDDPIAHSEGIDAVQACWESWWHAFGRLEITVNRTFGDDNRRANDWTLRATNDGPFAVPDGSTIPPTGRSVEIHGGSIIELADGRIRRQHDYFDFGELLAQLGITA